ncbi:MAG TPA: thioredoxin domain-containing protein [Puia sp.]|nr:thioredoxin domain-containing protein [Puia sp.]
MHVFTNHLIKETSPYLLQHAHNPVDWHGWNEESLQKAKSEKKPILLSIGYSACHWCHVMERESFEDENIAAIMNKNFVNIKVDREERPDLDHIYMDAVQTISGSGGWPLNVFLTPDCKPFYGGTYFPPKRLYNRPSWKEVLESIIDAFDKKNQEIVNQAESLTQYISTSNSVAAQQLNQEDDFEKIFNPTTMEEIFSSIMNNADNIDGGFGQAPKFPQSFTIQFLLHYNYYAKNETAKKQACLSLDKMIGGGIYDHLAGGFSRYSTDTKWLAPHFEKMLYDNALLITLLSEAYQLTKKELYADTIRQTMEFIKTEMVSPQNGFYSAIDADSEGEEGKYYVWNKKEVDEILQSDSELFCEYYGVSANGNWENKNILHATMEIDAFALKMNIDIEKLSFTFKRARQKLLLQRNKRAHPLVDDKIMLSWNALMNTACSKAFEALGIEEYKELAIANMEFLLKNFRLEDEFYFAHCFKNNQKKFPAFLDDLAFLIAALIQLQEITGDTFYLEKAKEITGFLNENFEDKETGLFFYNHQSQQDIILRKKEIYDGAIPSGNSVMILNLLYLSTIFDIPRWKQKAIDSCISISKLIIKYPTSFGVWATVLQAITYMIPEVVVTGEKLNVFRKQLLSNFIPFKIFQSTSFENNHFPLLTGKPIGSKPLIFLCQGYHCQPPVTETAELVQLLKNV